MSKMHTLALSEWNEQKEGRQITSMLPNPKIMHLFHDLAKEAATLNHLKPTP